MIEQSYVVTITDLTPDDRTPSCSELQDAIGSELGADLGLVRVEVFVGTRDAYYGPRCTCRVSHADDCDLRAHE